MDTSGNDEQGQETSHRDSPLNTTAADEPKDLAAGLNVKNPGKEDHANTSKEDMEESAEVESLCKSIDSYDWENDMVYQRALEHMSKANQHLEPLELEIRAKCFYWARKFKVEVDYPKYRDWKIYQTGVTSTVPSERSSASQNSSINSLTTGLSQSTVTENTPSRALAPGPRPLSEDTETSAPYPRNFAEVAEMITSGRGHLLSGIRTIPATVLSDKITPPTVELRKKPWEKDNTSLQAGGMFGDRRDIFIKQE